MSKKLCGILLGIILIISLVTLSGCTTDSSSQVDYADEKFIDSLSDGLEARWSKSTKDEKDEKDVTVAMMDSYIQAELDEITEFESATFKDTKLQEKALKYINCLKDAKEHIEYYYSDDYTELEKWNNIYNSRAVLIKDFVENYGLTVDDKYRSTLDEFLVTGKSVEQKESQKKAIEKLVDSLEFEVTNDEYGWKTYQATLNNVSEYDIKTLSVDVNLLNDEGTIIETEYTNAENVSKGKKAILEFSTDKDFKNIDLILNYYETE